MRWPAAKPSKAWACWPTPRKREFDMQRGYADPPFYPQALYNSLGEAYLDAKSPVLAAQAFEKALELTHNDLFALSGLVRAHAALGEKAKAEDAMARLLFVASDADTGLPIIERAKATGITAAPRDSSPAPQRNYALTSLERFGPNRWEPYEAPKLDVRDAQGKHVTLEDYRGKNVLLVFYLGAECPHCMRQLHDIGGKKADWERLNTVVLAVSSTPPAKNAAAHEGVRRSARASLVRRPVRERAPLPFLRRFRRSRAALDNPDRHQGPRVLGADGRRTVQRHGVPDQAARADERV